MLSISIYSDSHNDVEKLKVMIQDFLIKMKILAKVSYFNNSDDFITALGSYDIYIMDMDSKEDVVVLGNQKRAIDTGSHYVYIGSDESHPQKATKARCDYFIMKPIDKDEFIEIFQEIKKKIQDDNIIIKTAHGEKRVRVNHVNYIDIVKRCLCYHLSNGSIFDGQTLRTSFEKTIKPLNYHKAFLFLEPSTLINVGEVKEVNKDNVVFENDEVLFFPMRQYNKVREAWLNYTRFIE